MRERERERERERARVSVRERHLASGSFVASGDCSSEGVDAHVVDEEHQAALGAWVVTVAVVACMCVCVCVCV